MAKSHQTHFKCVQAFVRSLKFVTDKVFDQLQNAIDLRTNEPSGRMRRSAAALPIAMSLSSLVATGRKSEKGRG